MSDSLANACWPQSSLGDALLALARASGLPHTDTALRLPPSAAGEEELVNQWLTLAADRLGLQAEPVSAGYSEVPAMLVDAGPALVRVRVAGQPCWLALLYGGRRYLSVIGPNLLPARLRVAELEAVLRQPMEEPHLQPIDKLLNSAGLTPRQKNRARSALLSERLARESLDGCWMIRSPAGRDPRWIRRLTIVVGAHVMDQCCWLLAWSVLGWMTLTGRLETGWLAAWGLLLCCIVPFRLWSEAAGGKLSLDFSATLRRRLLAGALRMDPDQVRAEGTGGLLGRALEVDSLEQLALGGGLQSALSLVELFAAFVLLGPLAGQWILAGLLVGIIGFTAWMANRFLEHSEAWTSARLELTSELVERMIGHRTILAQESGDQARAATDQSLDRYMVLSQSLDRSVRRLQTVPARLWLLSGLLVLSPTFVKGSESVTSLAIALGGILFARQALQRFVEGLDRLLGARVSWRRLSPFLAASKRPIPVGDPDFACSEVPGISPVGASTGGDSVVLEGRDLVFRYPRRSEPVLNGVDLMIRQGERILLEGPSGGGKSTLATVLANSRAHQSGVLLLRGLDPRTLGPVWRRRVVLSPQFHHNHVFLGTFLYNLLLGRPWPPTVADAAQAERLCRDLELGPLLDRMPGGLQQMVGETGWQLSQGERSRLFLARAILQGADLVVLDESFAALDPETLSRTLPRVIDQVPTLVVIAHP